MTAIDKLVNRKLSFPAGHLTIGLTQIVSPLAALAGLVWSASAFGTGNVAFL